MNLEKLNQLIDTAKGLVEELEKLALATPRLQVCVIWDDVMTYVHYWDPRNPEPRIIYCQQGKADKDAVQEAACRALNLLSHKVYQLGIQWISDLPWEELPEDFQKLEEVFSVEKKKIEFEQKQIIGRSPHVVHHLQPKLQVSETD